MNDLVIPKNTKTPLLQHSSNAIEQQQNFSCPNTLKIGEQQETFMPYAKNIEQQTSDTNSNLTYINFIKTKANETSLEATFEPSSAFDRGSKNNLLPAYVKFRATSLPPRLYNKL